VKGGVYDWVGDACFKGTGIGGLMREEMAGEGRGNWEERTDLKWTARVFLNFPF